ncbi:hypothetical protein JTE90_026019 [Oedothorax gibbosus]|uniref:Meiosis-specific nuclear structural protein 1 n=1 Tax=Oedothorax gibbosus TaxID=931172 RepID=A0AAV6U2U5_9ARAC|nr:hypothetical protein JTE90_026019 [Oedothorax gibbosus]
MQPENNRGDLKDSVQVTSTNIKRNFFLCENFLSKELGDMKLNMQREEKLRQLLWERDPELRELRQKYLRANVTKDQVLQMAEKQALMEVKRREERSFTDEIRRQQELADAEERRKEIEQFQAKKKYHQDLENLRRFKLTRDSTSVSEREKEKNIIDAMLKKIEEEEIEAKKRLIEARIAFNQQAQELCKVREALKQQQKHREEADQFKVDEYRKAQELRAQVEAERKQLSLDQRLQIQEKLLSYLESLYHEKLKQEHLRTELAVEEKELFDMERERESEIKKIKVRQDLQHLYQFQMQVKKQKEDLQKKEEELYRQSLMAKLYEQDKLDLMSQHKRSLKRTEHLRLVKAMIEEKRKRKSLEKASELAEHKYRENLKSEHAKKVNEEKIRFLKEHAHELLGYMPKGIFESNEMVEIVGDDFKKFYSRKGCSK